VPSITKRTADKILWYRDEKAEPIPRCNTPRQLTKNQACLKDKSSFGQSILRVRLPSIRRTERQSATDKALRRISTMSEQIKRIQRMSSYQLVRWACQERNAQVATYLRSAALFLSNSLGVYVRYFGKLARRLAHEMYVRNATRTLQQFDDRILADIGMRRGEIEHAVRRGRLTRKTVANRIQPKPRHAA
jgi:uncharacterized protein YjiS (DUF1127 family)